MMLPFIDIVTAQVNFKQETIMNKKELYNSITFFDTSELEDYPVDKTITDRGTVFWG